MKECLFLRERGRERERERERESASVCFARLRFLLLLPTPDVCFHSRSGFHRRRRSCCCCCFHAGFYSEAGNERDEIFLPLFNYQIRMLHLAAIKQERGASNGGSQGYQNNSYRCLRFFLIFFREAILCKIQVAVVCSFTLKNRSFV